MRLSAAAVTFTGEELKPMQERKEDYQHRNKLTSSAYMLIRRIDVTVL